MKFVGNLATQWGKRMEEQVLPPLLRARDVYKLIGRGKSWLRQERLNGNFPQPVRCNNGRSIAFLREDVLQWVANLKRTG